MYTTETPVYYIRMCPRQLHASIKKENIYGKNYVFVRQLSVIHIQTSYHLNMGKFDSNILDLNLVSFIRLWFSNTHIAAKE
jgi:hypothetical protein